MSHRQISTDDSFGTRLHVSLKMRKLNQRQLADFIGANPDSVSHWLHNTYLPSTYSLKRICQVLHVSSDFLLGLGEGE